MPKLVVTVINFSLIEKISLMSESSVSRFGHLKGIAHIYCTPTSLIIIFPNTHWPKIDC